MSQTNDSMNYIRTSLKWLEKYNMILQDVNNSNY